MRKAMKPRTLVLAAAAMMLAACSEEHRAKSLADSFLDDHLKSGQYSIVNYSKLDSTYFVTDSTAAALAASVNASGRFSPFVYDKSKLTKKLLFMKIRYVTGKDTLKQTFYFDDTLHHIVTLKNN